MWQTIYVFFLNGIGKIKLQMILVSISALINIPLSIFLGRKFGLSGVISANTIVFVFMSILFHIQTKMILEQRALKIFNK
jgi:O-antigen/teichoic acid export membrane protein